MKYMLHMEGSEYYGKNLVPLGTDLEKAKKKAEKFIHDLVAVEGFLQGECPSSVKIVQVDPVCSVNARKIFKAALDEEEKRNDAEAEAYDLRLYEQLKAKFEKPQ